MGTKSVYQKINDPLYCPNSHGDVEMLCENHKDFFEKDFFRGLEEPDIFRQCPIEIQHASTFEIMLLSLIMYSKTNEISGMLEVENRGFGEKNLRLAYFAKNFYAEYFDLREYFDRQLPKIKVLYDLHDDEFLNASANMCGMRDVDVGIFFAEEGHNISFRVHGYCAKIGLKNYLVVEGF